MARPEMFEGAFQPPRVIWVIQLTDGFMESQAAAGN